MNRNQIQERLERNRISFTPELPERLEIYLALLKEWNARMDLTAVMDDEELADRHLMDSLCVLRTELIPRRASFIDVGTGAGFPGMPLAMAREDLSIVLMDAQQKRLNFLEAVREATGIRNIQLLHARAEEAARQQNYRERFDLATARAVAPLNILSEYLLPFVKKGGTCLCWKGPSVSEELEAGKKACRILGGQTEEPISYRIADRNWDHRLLVIRKIAKTPSLYPRKAGTPKAKPLGVG